MSSSELAYPLWHPYTQMQQSERIEIVKGRGAHLYDARGNAYIDAVSSWWTNIHGHAHPHIAAAIAKQAHELEHVIFAGFTHPAAIALGQKLLQRIPFHAKVFYSDNGSTAVEVALKMALQYWSNQGTARRKIVCFRDAYHGDTFGAMSVSARGVFTQPYSPLLFDVVFIDTPGPHNENEVVDQLKTILAGTQGKEVAAFIFEPLVLGSAGMLMYSEQVLDRLMDVCHAADVLTIADEVMTGFGRTGKFLATDYCHTKPDIICLSKGITGGFLPFAATTCTQAIYDAFLSGEKTKMLFHGHSYSGNPIGCAAAVAGLELFETENTFGAMAALSSGHQHFAATLAGHKHVKEVRLRGTILAIELSTEEASGYLNTIRDKAYAFFLERHIIMRPLGNVIYVLPPYCISPDDLQQIYRAISDFLNVEL